MARRVVLGRFGPSSTDWGLRVSKPGKDAVTSSASTLVSVENLLFDSSNAVDGSLRLIGTNTLTVDNGDSVTWVFASPEINVFPLVLYSYRFDDDPSGVEWSGAVGPMAGNALGWGFTSNNNQSVFFSCTKSEITFKNGRIASTNTATIRVALLSPE